MLTLLFSVRRLYALCCFWIVGIAVNGQNVESLLEMKNDSTPLYRRFLHGDPFSLTGNYGCNLRSYHTDAAMNRQTPLSSTIFANATAQFFQITIPVNFILNNLDNVSHPFHSGYLDGFISNQRNRLSRIGISPYYKWIKVHAGHRYMNFSDFTLANHNFLGGGVELTPGKWRFSAMAGRLAKAEPIDLALDRPNLPVYQRNGWGMKVGYGTNTNFIDLILFNAQDRENSLQLGPQPDVDVQPAENLVLAIKGRKEMFKRLHLDFEVARSGHSRDKQAPLSESQSIWNLDYNNALLRRRTSTLYGNAASANINYRLNKLSIGAGYQRIDPNFKTFGAYFFNDDLENITLQLGAYGIKNLSLNGSAGLQRNNLDKTRPATYRRFIMALNANYQVKTWNFGANYSNFNSDIQYVLNQEMDSLRVVIVTTDASLQIGKSIVGGQGTLHNFNLRGGEQKVNQNIETPTGNPATSMYYANLGYQLRLPSKWNFSLMLDYNQNALSGIRQDRYGLGAKVGKSFLQNKIDLSLGTQNYKGVSREDARSSLQSNHHIRAQWRITKTQSIQMQFATIRNSRITNNSADIFNEYVGSIGFNGQFQYRPFSKKNQAK